MLPAPARPAKFIPDARIDWPDGYDPSSAQVFAQNAIDVAATPEVAWSLLIDCERWPNWYSHCSDASILRGGSLLGPDCRFRFKTLGFYFEPEIDRFEPSRLLVWSAKGPAGTSGAHAWYIERTSTGCHVVTEEVQCGLLLSIIGRRTRKRLLTAHGEWLRGLKFLAERR
jgi:hypothetical protein